MVFTWGAGSRKRIMLRMGEIWTGGTIVNEIELVDEEQRQRADDADQAPGAAGRRPSQQEEEEFRPLSALRAALLVASKSHDRFLIPR